MNTLCSQSHEWGGLSNVQTQIIAYSTGQISTTRWLCSDQHNSMAVFRSKACDIVSTYRGLELSTVSWLVSVCWLTQPTTRDYIRAENRLQSYGTRYRYISVKHTRHKHQDNVTVVAMMMTSVFHISLHFFPSSLFQVSFSTVRDVAPVCEQNLASVAVRVCLLACIRSFVPESIELGISCCLYLSTCVYLFVCS